MRQITEINFLHRLKKNPRKYKKYFNEQTALILIWCWDIVSWHQVQNHMQYLLYKSILCFILYIHHFYLTLGRKTATVDITVRDGQRESLFQYPDDLVFMFQPVSAQKGLPE